MKKSLFNLLVLAILVLPVVFIFSFIMKNLLGCLFSIIMLVAFSFVEEEKKGV